MSICIKVNCSGSWATLIPSLKPQKLEDAMMACDAIAACTDGHISFQVVEKGVPVLRWDKKPPRNKPFGWYDPRGKEDKQDGTH